jgi:hypothetical protein
MKTKHDDNQIVDNSLNRERINKWDHEKNSDFQNNLSSKFMNDLETVNLNNLTREKINSFVHELGNVLLDSAKNTFGTHTIKPKRKQTYLREHKP